MNLYTQVALGRPPQDYAGHPEHAPVRLQGGGRRTARLAPDPDEPQGGHPGHLGLYVAAQAWAIVATGTWYLLAFGLYGAGELVGVYAPNYILSASRTVADAAEHGPDDADDGPRGPRRVPLRRSLRPGRAALRPGRRIPDELRGLRVASWPSAIVVALWSSSPPGPGSSRTERVSPKRTPNHDLPARPRASSTGTRSRTCGPSTPGTPRSSASTTASSSPRSTSARGSRASTTGPTSRARPTTAGPGAADPLARRNEPPGDRPIPSGSAGRPTARSSASEAATTATTPRRGWSTGATSATSRWT